MMDKINSGRISKLQLDLLDTGSMADTFSSFGEGTFQSLNLHNTNSQSSHRIVLNGGSTEEKNPSSQKTHELIGEYQNLLCDMKSQINQIKGKFGITPTSQGPVRNDSKVSVKNSIELFEKNSQEELMNDTTRTRSQIQINTFAKQNDSNSNSVNETKVTSPLMKIQENQSQKVSKLNLLENLQQRYNSNDDKQESAHEEIQEHLTNRFATKQQQQYSQEQYEDNEDIQYPDRTISPPQAKHINRRITDYYNQRDNNSQEREEALGHQRRILSSMNLRQSIINPPQDNALISTSSNYKFTNTSCQSPTSPNLKCSIKSPMGFVMNKENLNNTNSPLNLNHLTSYKNNNGDLEARFNEQVKLNKQLIDQIKDLKGKLSIQQQKLTEEHEIRLIKHINNEEHLHAKVIQLSQLNDDLNFQIQNLQYQVQLSLKSNQELENYIENNQESQEQQIDKQKMFNKKIQELQKKNADLSKVNSDLDQKVKLLEQEKTKLSEKWIRLSARTKVDERNKSKQRDKEVKVEHLTKELEVLKSKVEVMEKENTHLKEENTTQQKKLNQCQTIIKELSSSNEAFDKEKSLADKVTSELLQRIQRYENEIAEIREKNNLLVSQVQQNGKDAQELKNIEQDMKALQQKMEQMSQESYELQTVNSELEGDNQRLIQELQRIMSEQQTKDQQIESLQLQVEHQTEQCRELQKDFSEIIEQVKRKENFLGFKFSNQDLREAVDYLMQQSLLDNDQNPQSYYTQQDCKESELLAKLTIKGAQRIKILNKYVEGLKGESEDFNQKYDRLSAKFRETSIENDNLRNLLEVTQAQNNNSQSEVEELKTYIQELEGIIKNGGMTTQPLLNFTQDNSLGQNMGNPAITSSIPSLQPQFSNEQLLHHQPIYDRSPSIMHLYSSIPNEGQIINEFQDEPQIYQSMNSQNTQSYQQFSQASFPSQNQQSVKFLERVGTSKRDISKIPLVQQSYDHSRICLPTVFLQSQSQNSQNKFKVNHSLEFNRNENGEFADQNQNDISLQDKIKNTLSHYKKQQSQQRNNSKPKNKQSISLIKPNHNQQMTQRSSVFSTLSPMSGGQGSNNPSQSQYWSQRSLVNSSQMMRASQQSINGGFQQFGSQTDCSRPPRYQMS